MFRNITAAAFILYLFQVNLYAVEKKIAVLDFSSENFNYRLHLHNILSIIND